MDGGAGFVDIAKNAIHTAMNQIAEIGTGRSTFAADAVAFGALQLGAEEKFAAMFPIAVGLGRRPAIIAGQELESDAFAVGLRFPHMTISASAQEPFQAVTGTKFFPDG